MILLDTNVVSEVQKRAGAVQVRERVAAAGERPFLSVVVLGELRYGIDLLGDDARRASLSQWYVRLLADYRDRILPVTREIAESWGRLQAGARRRGRPLEVPDGLIAATALVHDLTLWTRNVRDFDDLGLRLFNPWEG